MATHAQSHHRIAGLASLAGTTIEWYDFFLYGTAAALVFNKLFFPEMDPLSGLFAAFATYAVGFIGRPLGGIIFGHFGDRVGRKAMLILTLMMMGLPTIAIGLIPTHAQIGYWAAALLVLLRFLQGIAVGGEEGGLGGHDFGRQRTIRVEGRVGGGDEFVEGRWGHGIKKLRN